MRFFPARCIPCASKIDSPSLPSQKKSKVKAQLLEALAHTGEQGDHSDPGSRCESCLFFLRFLRPFLFCDFTYFPLVCLWNRRAGPRDPQNALRRSATAKVRLLAAEQELDLLRSQVDMEVRTTEHSFCFGGVGM